jgi:lipooligosaccharide transport system permease protein
MTTKTSGTWTLAWHIVVRNWAVYKKDFIANVSPTVADPALTLFALGLGLSPFIQQVEGLSYAAYLAPGLVATTAFFTAYFETSYGFYVRMTFESVFKAMLTTPIGVKEIILGEFLWVFLKGTLMAAGVGLVLALLGLVPNWESLFVVPFLGGWLALPMGALGLVASGYVRNMNQFQTVYSFLIAPMYFLSGVFFPLSGRPIVEKIMWVSPFTHGVSLLQMAMWGRYEAKPFLLHAGAMAAFTLVLGFWAYRRMRTKLIA